MSPRLGKPAAASGALALVFFHAGKGLRLDRNPLAFADLRVITIGLPASAVLGRLRTVTQPLGLPVSLSPSESEVDHSRFGATYENRMYLGRAGSHAARPVTGGERRDTCPIRINGYAGRRRRYGALCHKKTAKRSLDEVKDPVEVRPASRTIRGIGIYPNSGFLATLAFLTLLLNGQNYGRTRRRGGSCVGLFPPPRPATLPPPPPKFCACASESGVSYRDLGIRCPFFTRSWPSRLVPASLETQVQP